MTDNWKQPPIQSKPHVERVEIRKDQTWSLHNAEWQRYFTATSDQIGTNKTDIATNAADIAALQALWQAVWHVGSIFISTNSANPSTYFGFGTWAAFGSGKVLIGIDSGDADFDTVEETGGAKTVDLSHTHDFAHTHELEHTHPIDHTHGAGTDITTGADIDASYAGDSGAADDATTDSQSTSDTDSKLSATQSIVQPYIVVYMWKRTA